MRGTENYFSGRTFFYNANFEESPVFHAKEVIDKEFVESPDETSISGELVDVAIVDRENKKGEKFKQIRLTVVDKALNEKYITSFGFNKISRGILNSLIGAMEKWMKGHVALFLYEKASTWADGKTYNNKNCGIKFNGEFAPWKWMPAETKQWAIVAKDAKWNDLLVNGKRVVSYDEYDKKINEYMPKLKEYFGGAVAPTEVEDSEEDIGEVPADTIKTVQANLKAAKTAKVDDDLPF